MFELFYDYFSSLSKFSSLLDKRINKVYYSVTANTRQFPIFNYYHSLFYNSEGKKIVPSNIGDLLSPRGLAYRLIDDGYCDRYTIYLCTDSFTIEEVELLIKVLYSNFGLVATLQKRDTIARKTRRVRFSGKAENLNLFRSLVLPYFISSMTYKLFFVKS